MEGKSKLIPSNNVTIQQGEDGIEVVCQVEFDKAKSGQYNKDVPLHQMLTSAEEELSEDLSRNKKLKQFCPKWLRVDVLKDWVAPHDNVCKARCIACNKVLNAGKSELVKHAAGRKHAKNMELLFSSGVGNLDNVCEQQTESAIDHLSTVLEIVDDQEYHKPAQDTCALESQTQTDFEGNETSKLLQSERKLAVLTRIANAMERIADSLEATSSLPTRSSPST